MQTTLNKKTVTWEALNDNERSMLTYLYIQQSPEHLTGMQDVLFGDLGTGTSMTRNVLRRLRRCGLVFRTSPGSYKISKHGMKITKLTRKAPMSAAKKAIQRNKKRILKAVA